MIFTLFLIPFVSVSAVHFLPRHDSHHDHVLNRRLPGNSWYHERDHPVHSLFKRDDETFPAVGSAGTFFLVPLILFSIFLSLVKWLSN